MTVSAHAYHRPVCLWRARRFVQSVFSVARLASEPSRIVLEHKPELRVGVISDTHLPYRMARLPQRVIELLRGVDIILHAGDVDRLDHLEPLRRLAPLYAVQGNVHFLELSDGGSELPVTLHLTLAGHHVVLTHGGWPDLWTKASDWVVEHLLGPGGERVNQRMARRLLRQYPEASVIIFGHTHRAYQAWHGDTLLFNPGGVCPSVGRVPSLGMLRLSPDHIEAQVIVLDG